MRREWQGLCLGLPSVAACLSIGSISNTVSPNVEMRRKSYLSASISGKWPSDYHWMYRESERMKTILYDLASQGNGSLSLYSTAARAMINHEALMELPH